MGKIHKIWQNPSQADIQGESSADIQGESSLDENSPEHHIFAMF